MSETSVVERLARKWHKQVLPGVDVDQSNLTGPVHDARWWMEAIAEELDEESTQIAQALVRVDHIDERAVTHSVDRSFALFRAARFLRTAATPEESRE